MGTKGQIWILPAVLALATGCASQNHWPELDEKASRAVLAVGYFEHARYLNERPCRMTDEEISSGVVDCFATAPPLQATFVVQQTVFGTFRSRRVRVAAHATHGMDDFPLGRAQPQIVLFVSDDEHTIADSWSDVAVLRSGKRAVPVADEFELRFLPCDAAAMVGPLDFAPPYPSRPLAELDEEWVASIRGIPGLTVAGNSLRVGRGLAVDDIARLLIEHPAGADEWEPGSSEPCAAR